MNRVMSGVVGAATASSVVSPVAHAQQRTMSVTVTNVAAAKSVSFSLTQLGFHRGACDVLNFGGLARPETISVGERGTGLQWEADAAAADPTLMRGAIAWAFCRQASPAVSASSSTPG